MGDAVFYLVYISAATELFEDEALASLLQTARENNSRRGITGLLLYYEGNFIEILEGPRETVEWLFHKKLLLDKRHRFVTRLISGFVPNRSFPDWSMGFERIDRDFMDGHLPNFNDIIESRAELERELPDVYAPLLVLLRSFYRSSGISADES